METVFPISGTSVSQVIFPFVLMNFYPTDFFNVRVGSILFELHGREMGVLRGSVLSPALLKIKINNIGKSVLKGTDSSFFNFIEDFALCIRGKSV